MSRKFLWGMSRKIEMALQVGPAPTVTAVVMPITTKNGKAREE
jgi:hypothetical protein